MELGAEYWADRYANAETGWDLGGVSTPLKAYFDQLADKGLRILIPGGGRSYEAEYLHRSGFRNVHVVDLAEAPFASLLGRCPDFPRAHLHQGNFFDHAGRYDRIIEQTFFCALPPGLRGAYVEKMHALLVPGGVLAGVLFDDPLFADHPPFGGSAAEYRERFAKQFPAVSVEPCYNSIAPRAGREVWIRARRNSGADA